MNNRTTLINSATPQDDTYLITRIVPTSDEKKAEAICRLYELDTPDESIRAEILCTGSVTLTSSSCHASQYIGQPYSSGWAMLTTKQYVLTESPDNFDEIIDDGPDTWEEMESLSKSLRVEALRDGRTVEDLLSKLPEARREVFEETYGKEQVEAWEKEWQNARKS